MKSCLNPHKDNCSICHAPHTWLSMLRALQNGWSKGRKSSLNQRGQRQLILSTAEIWFPSQLESTESQPIQPTTCHSHYLAKPGPTSWLHPLLEGMGSEDREARWRPVGTLKGCPVFSFPLLSFMTTFLNSLPLQQEAEFDGIQKMSNIQINSAGTCYFLTLPTTHPYGRNCYRACLQKPLETKLTPWRKTKAIR